MSAVWPMLRRGQGTEKNCLIFARLSPFKGRGALRQAATKELRPAWESGSAAEAADAMASFLESHGRSFLDHSPVDKSDTNAMAAWTSKVSKWLFSTNHINVEYGVQYEGVAIERLSPGTRGIVLLLLYLAIDREDDRPLIIDQPEENLDPKSIFDELVEASERPKPAVRLSLSRIMPTWSSMPTQTRSSSPNAAHIAPAPCRQ